MRIKKRITRNSLQAKEAPVHQQVKKELRDYFFTTREAINSIFQITKRLPNFSSTALKENLLMGMILKNHCKNQNIQIEMSGIQQSVEDTELQMKYNAKLDARTKRKTIYIFYLTKTYSLIWKKYSPSMQGQIEQRYNFENQLITIKFSESLQ